MTQFNDNFWDERYSEKEYIYGREPNYFFKANIENLAPGRILLPGEGEGRNAVFAALKGWTVDATDQSYVGKEKAIQLAAEFNVNINYEVCDIQEYLFKENNYDAVALIYFHLPEVLRRKIHGKILSSMKKNAILIFEMFSKDQLGKASGGPQDFDMLYSISDIERDFGKLDPLYLNSESIFLNEGKKHCGEASVIRYVGKKSF